MNRNRSFDDVTAEKLAHYVYCLIDPRDEKVFYIGKGQDNRIFDHEDSIDLAEPEEIVRAKQKRIADIRSSGRQVHEVMLRHGLSSSSEAFDIEAAILDFCDCQSIPLTNLQGGHKSNYFGLTSVDGIKSRYSAEMIAYFDEKTIIININRQYKRQQSPEQILELTRSAWAVSLSNASQAKLAIATAQGIIRGVFRIHNWYKVQLDESAKAMTKGRYAFNGEIETQLWQRYVGKSVPLVRNAANPVRYAVTPSKDYQGKYWYAQKADSNTE